MSAEHAGCQEAWAKQKQRAGFAEARLAALAAEIHYLAHRMDGISGHAVHASLGNKTLGGAVRVLLSTSSVRGEGDG